MTTLQHHQLDQLRLEWKVLARSKASREAADLLAQRSKPLQRCVISDLRDVLAALEPNGPLSVNERAEVARDLLASIRLHPLFARTLLQTLLPGIVTVARKLRWGAGTGDDPSAFLADLITAAYELITEWAGQERPYAAPDLLNALRCRMRRRIIPASTNEIVSTPLIEADAENQASTRHDHVAELAELIVAHRSELDPLGATALYGREVLGYSYRELSAMTGASQKRLAHAGREVARRIVE